MYQRYETISEKTVRKTGFKEEIHIPKRSEEGYSSPFPQKGRFFFRLEEYFPHSEEEG